jgi:hypothetical protein
MKLSRQQVAQQDAAAIFIGAPALLLNTEAL